jgi:general nucleoside transport system permease protein
MLITGTFTSAAATFYTGNPWLGVLCALIAEGMSAAKGFIAIAALYHVR